MFISQTVTNWNGILYTGLKMTLIIVTRSDTWWCRWLRQCCTSQKVAGSISGGVIEISHWLNPSGPTITLMSTQPLKRNEYQAFSLEGKGGRYVELTSLPPSFADCVEILGTSTSWSTKGLFRPVMECLILRAWILKKTRLPSYTQDVCVCRIREGEL